jgi:uncharacterized lipoprotein YmbA
MNPSSPRRAVLLLTLAGWVVLTGCSALRPVAVVERHFVLSPLPPETAASASRPATIGLSVAVGPVRVPAYLASNRLAVRRGPNEISYLDGDLWAERLDKGAQRVLMANLTTLLPNAAIGPSTWRPAEVSAEVQVQLQQFDVDAAGQGVLAATWRIVTPASEKVLGSGRSRDTLLGPPPSPDPYGAVATLSRLLGRLSEELAQALAQAATHEPRP